VGHFERKF